LGRVRGRRPLGSRPIKVDGAGFQVAVEPSANQRGEHVESVGAIVAAASTASPDSPDSATGGVCAIRRYRP
jgi:hypothetical protein